MPSKIEWESHIKEFKSKSITLTEYSKIHNLPYRALCYWFRKDNKEALLKKRQLREYLNPLQILKIYDFHHLFHLQKLRLNFLPL